MMVSGNIVEGNDEFGVIAGAAPNDSQFQTRVISITNNIVRSRLYYKEGSNLMRPTNCSDSVVAENLSYQSAVDVLLYAKRADGAVTNCSVQRNQCYGIGSESGFTTRFPIWLRGNVTGCVTSHNTLYNCHNSIDFSKGSGNVALGRRSIKRYLIIWLEIQWGRPLLFHWKSNSCSSSR